MNNVRGRAWRRFNKKIKANNGRHSKAQKWLPEKNWKLLYLRSVKLARARQLGQEYPRRTIRQCLDEELPLDK